MKRAQERPQVNFRPSAALKKRIQASADHHGMPLNAEIIRRLEQSFVAETLTDLVEVTAQRVATQVSVELKDQMMSYVNAVLTANELHEKRKRDEQQRQQEAGNG
jgi:Arc-like DNA binding dprotein